MTRLATFAVAGILGLAGVMKFSDPNTFALDIYNYGLLPRALLQPLAYILPPLEIVTAVALFLPRYRKAAWALAGLLFLVFTLAVAFAVARGLDVSCGCFGGALTVSWYHLLANSLLVALCLWSFRQTEPTMLSSNVSRSHRIA